jgi:hypothetical protein
MRYFYLAIALAAGFTAYCLYNIVDNTRDTIKQRIQLIDRSAQ